MSKWLTLPNDKLIYQPDQQNFLQAHRERLCKKCLKLFIQLPPTGRCPDCGEKGVRRWDRLTIIAGRRWGKSRVGSICGTEEASINNTIGWACAPTNPK